MAVLETVRRCQASLAGLSAGQENHEQLVIMSDLRAMADWLPPRAQRISGISCVSLALDGSSSSASRRGHWHTILLGKKRQKRRMQWFKPVYIGPS